jgi:ribonucleoside-diphosphate reductase alpha chain
MEQPLPPYGSCNLGSLDLSKFSDKDGNFDWELFEFAIRLSVRFLDSVISKNSYPITEIQDVSNKSRPVGLGVMGLADHFMINEMIYGSLESLDNFYKIMSFLYEKSVDESERLGTEKGVPEWCANLTKPRRNITVVSIAPTGTISILADCNSGIEPFFSEITERRDKTGEYTIDISSDKPYFRCAVSSSGKDIEVRWDEHISMQSVAQKWCDSGVSKTINFPSHTRKETIAKAYMMAWKSNCKGITVYRNGSRTVEVLSPKNISKDRCPVCGEQTIKTDGCTKCSSCDWSVCSVG